MWASKFDRQPIKSLNFSSWIWAPKLKKPCKWFKSSADPFWRSSFHVGRSNGWMRAHFPIKTWRKDPTFCAREQMNICAALTAADVCWGLRWKSTSETTWAKTSQSQTGHVDSNTHQQFITLRYNFVTFFVHSKKNWKKEKKNLLHIFFIIETTSWDSDLHKNQRKEFNLVQRL